MNPNNANYLGMTFGQAGFVEDPSILNLKIGDRLGPNPTVLDLGGGIKQELAWPAYTGFANQTILLGRDYEAADSAGRDQFFVHELMHLFIQGGHAPIANALGLRDPNGNEYPDESKMTVSEIAAMKIQIENFLSNDCK